MRPINKLLATACFVASASAAQAGNISYDASSYDTVEGSHSIWIQTGIAGLGTDFNFDPTGIFDTDMANWGRLYGSVFAAGEEDPDNGFTIDFSYNGDTDARTGFKNGGGGFDGGVLDPSIYFLNMTGGTMTGFGSLLDGVELSVTRKPYDGTLATQIGEGANDKNGEFGLSNWFMVECVVCSPSIFEQVNGSQGDVNINLAATDRQVEPVPLPAAGWLLLASVGGLAAAKRRKTA